MIFATATRAAGQDSAAALGQGAEQLALCTDAPRLEAELLLAHVLGCSRASLHAHPERRLDDGQQAAFLTLVQRRAQGEPLPYLTGRAEFYGLDFLVDRRVLIPRPETETLVELALALLGDGPSVVADVGTGSGCIAVTLAARAPQAHVYALDLSPDALDVARANGDRHGVTGRVTFLASDLLSALPEAVDLVVANPPYIAADEWPTLPTGVRSHEPRLALDGGPDGLDVVRALLHQAPAHLRSGGAMLIEIGARQGAAATQLARAAFPDAVVALHADLSGRDRVVSIRTKSEEG